MSVITFRRNRTDIFWSECLCKKYKSKKREWTYTMETDKEFQNRIKEFLNSEDKLQDVSHLLNTNNYILYKKRGLEHSMSEKAFFVMHLIWALKEPIKIRKGWL